MDITTLAEYQMRKLLERSIYISNINVSNIGVLTNSKWLLINGKIISELLTMQQKWEQYLPITLQIQLEMELALECQHLENQRLLAISDFKGRLPGWQDLLDWLS